MEKANMDAFNATFIGSTAPNGPANLGPRSGGSTVGNVTHERFERGRVYYGKPGEEPKSLASNTPSPQYMEFVELSLRIIGSAIGLPYEFLMLDFSKGSYSSSRAALLQTYRTFTGWQEWLTQSFLQRVWNWRVAKAIKEGTISPAPIDANGVSEWHKVQWSFPEFGWVDPQREAAAGLLEYNMGVSSLSMLTRKKGRDAEDVLKEKGADMATAARIAKELNDENGTSFTWKDLIQTGIPGQVPATTEPPDENGEIPEDKDDKDGIGKWL